MLRPVRTHTFNGRRYKIDLVGYKLDGMIEAFALKDRMMYIMAEAGTKLELETLIHESLHAENWAETEKVVSRVGKEIADFLWRLGYRRTKK